MLSDIQGEARSRVAGIISHQGTMATVLYAIAIRAFGEEVHSWEPETVAMEMNEAFGTEMHPDNHDKLMALMVAIETNSFYNTWSAFEVVCRTINTGEPYGSDELLVAEMAWGVTEVLLNDDTPAKFSDEIRSGVGRLLFEEGIMHPPSKLGFAIIPGGDGSYTGVTPGKQETLSGEHLAVVNDYLREQATLLLRQIAALPWHTEESLVSIVEEMAAQ